MLAKDQIIDNTESSSGMKVGHTDRSNGKFSVFGTFTVKLTAEEANATE